MSNNPTQLKAWHTLEAHAVEIQKNTTSSFFENDKQRHKTLSYQIDGMLLDISKQCITQDTIEQLVHLAKECELEEKRHKMFNGALVNHTENRAVLHTALRCKPGQDITIDGQNVYDQIQTVQKSMREFTKSFRDGDVTGSTGKPLNTIVSIGVGGSDLGMRTVCRALRNKKSLETHFVANIDGAELEDILALINPAETLFIVTSKSFGTQETLTNAETARQWLKTQLSTSDNIERHFLAVTAQHEKAVDFGIDKDRIFPMWDWVNGRFSLWSAVGLPICLQNGYGDFQELLNGAQKMDKHFLSAPLEENLPTLLGLISIWNNNFLNHHCHAVLPYAQKLKHFPAYIQQLEMESNGKNINNNGDLIIDYSTAPAIFGDVGTNGQHSFYQLLHQGIETVPCDLIGFIETDTDPEHHKLLMNNMMAQGQAFMQGRQEYSAKEPYRYFSGNKPNSTLLIKRLDPQHLGMLMALYEHKCFVQGAIWNINSFDQFGVELGKELSKKIETDDLSLMDPSTRQLYSLIHNRQK